MDADFKLELIAVVGKFSDGTCREILLEPETREVVLSAIMQMESTIRITERTLDVIDLELPKAETAAP